MRALHVCIILSFLTCLVNVCDCSSGPLELTRYEINSTVQVRYSQTVVFIELRSNGTASEYIFETHMPQQAFVSKFRLRLVPGTWQNADVKTKADAEQIYQEAVSSGKSAAQVKEVAPQRGMAVFKVPINVRAGAVVQAELTYDELIERRLGKFSHRVSVRPGMKEFKGISVNAAIRDPQGVVSLNATYKPDENKDAVAIEKVVPKRESITSFSIDAFASTTSLAGFSQGELVLEYDTGRDFDAGMLMAQGQYFVHFFSPELPKTGYHALPKAVHFVVDISGSMSGLKEEQARAAMIEILGQLNSNDIFDVLLFDDKQIEWQGRLVGATSANVQTAQQWVLKNLHASGSTGIHDALLKSLKRMNQVSSQEYVKMSIFLSDGQPSYGITDPQRIREAARFYESHTCLHSLGFGFDVDFGFLESLSWENYGVARRIYTESDAAIQLQTFFAELSEPLLRDIALQWPSTMQARLVSSTQVNPTVYFGGSEICTVGSLVASKASSFADTFAMAQEAVSGLRVSARAKASVDGALSDEDLSLKPSSASFALDTPGRRLASSEASMVPNGFAERLWAHLRIKELLRKATALNASFDRDSIRNESLQLALKYALVTPLTSLVVVEPPSPSPPTSGAPGAPPPPPSPAPRPYPAGGLSKSFSRSGGYHNQMSSAVKLRCGNAWLLVLSALYCVAIAVGKD